MSVVGILFPSCFSLPSHRTYRFKTADRQRSVKRDPRSGRDSAKRVPSWTDMFLVFFQRPVSPAHVNGRRTCEIERFLFFSQVGNYFAIYVHTWMRRVPQRAIRCRWACQVRNFFAVFVLTWTIRRRENCLKSIHRIDHHHHHLVEIADNQHIC